MPERRTKAAAAVVKHSVVIAGHRTSVSLEDMFWTSLKDIAKRRGRTVAAMVADIDGERGASNLSSAIRVFVLVEAKRQAEPR